MPEAAFVNVERLRRDQDLVARDVPDGDARTDDDPRFLRPVALAELLNYPTPDWIIRYVLQRRSFIVVYGASGSGKTFLKLDMAFGIARGERWFGRRVKRGGVIYVAGEGHLKMRCQAYLDYHGLSAADVPNIRFVASNVNLMDTAADSDLDTLIQQIKKTADDIGGIALVVLDTLNAMMPGGDENSSEDMGRMIQAARKIMATVECAVAYVHHCGKDESKGSRGHSSLRAAIDCEIQVTDNGGARVATVTKLRDGEAGQQFAFRLQVVDLGSDPDPDADAGERISSCAVVALDQVPVAQKQKARMPKNCDLAMRALRDSIGDYGDALPASSGIPPGTRGVSLEAWRTRYYALDPLDAESSDGKAQDARLKRFSRAKEALLNEALVMACNLWVWIA